MSITSVMAEDLFLSASRHDNYVSALDNLTIAINNHNYTLIKIQPVDKGLRIKGYEAKNYKVLFFGNHEQVARVLAANPEASVILPHKIILFKKGNTVTAIAPRLGMWKGKFGTKLDLMIDRWDQDFKTILKEYASTENAT